MKISIYTVFKRYPLEWLEECLSGVRSQIIDEEWEYIFVIYGKDNDLDGILRVLQDNIESYSLYYLPDTENFIDAIMFAINKCKGEYVLRADADDILMPNATQRMYEHIEEHDAGIVIPDYVIKGNGIVKGDVNNNVANCLIERDKYNYVKYMKGQTFRDGTSLLKMFNEYGFSITYLDQPCYIYRPNPNSLTHDLDKVKKMDKLIKEE